LKCLVSTAKEASLELLKGRICVVTGAAQGIGLAVASTFAAEGASVVLADINLEGAKDAASALATCYKSVIAVGCDVTSPEEVEGLVSTCVAELGGLDVFVNNAGITRDATMRKMTVEDFQQVMDVHVLGAWLGTRAAARVMRERRRGSIVNMSSISGKVGNIGQTNYSSAKAALVGLTKSSAKELAYVGVRVNAIQPGLIRTAMTESMRLDIWKQKIAEVPMGRAGEVEEVASVALFLASDLSSYMTGTVLEVTGGRYM
jgi:3-oxoacyl-[acyl-carrier protein] reductase